MDVQLQGDFAEGVKALQTTLAAAAERLATDLYDRPDHYLLELIQNADDNRYADGVLPSPAVSSIVTSLT